MDESSIAGHPPRNTPGILLDSGKNYVPHLGELLPFQGRKEFLSVRLESLAESLTKACRVRAFQRESSESCLFHKFRNDSGISYTFAV